jgi:hypothetical protein
MYSPKIDEKLIPLIYHTAKAQGVPMTTLVNRLLIKALAQEKLPSAVRDALASYAISTADRHRQDLTANSPPSTESHPTRDRKMPTVDHEEDISKSIESPFACKTNPNQSLNVPTRNPL